MLITIRNWLAAGFFVLVAVIAGCDSGKPEPAGQISRSGPATVEGQHVKNLNRDGDIWIGGAPEPGSLDSLAAQGVTTVIDLRQERQKPPDAAATARQAGLRYHAIPMSSTTLPADQAKAFLDVMHQRPKGGVLIHCSSGNRAAAMYGLYLGAEEGLTPEQALARARKAGLSNASLTHDLERCLEQHDAATRPAR